MLDRILGELRLDGLSPAPKGRLKIDVTVDIDADGVMLVALRDPLSGRARSWTFGHDATFRLLADTPACVNASVSSAPPLNTNPPAPRLAVVPAPPASEACPPVVAAAQTTLTRAERFVAQSLEISPRWLHLLATYMSGVSQSLVAQTCTGIETRTRALQTVLDSLAALSAGDTRRTAEELITLIAAENNPQARSDLGQILRQIGRHATQHPH